MITFIVDDDCYNIFQDISALNNEDIFVYFLDNFITAPDIRISGRKLTIKGEFRKNEKRSDGSFYEPFSIKILKSDGFPFLDVWLEQQEVDVLEDNGSLKIHIGNGLGYDIRPTMFAPLSESDIETWLKFDGVETGLEVPIAALISHEGQTAPNISTVRKRVQVTDRETTSSDDPPERSVDFSQGVQLEYTLWRPDGRCMRYQESQGLEPDRYILALRIRSEIGADRHIGLLEELMNDRPDRVEFTQEPARPADTSRTGRRLKSFNVPIEKAKIQQAIGRDIHILEVEGPEEIGRHQVLVRPGQRHGFHRPYWCDGKAGAKQEFKAHLRPLVQSADATEDMKWVEFEPKNGARDRPNTGVLEAELSPAQGGESVIVALHLEARRPLALVVDSGAHSRLINLCLRANGDEVAPQPINVGQNMRHRQEMDPNEMLSEVAFVSPEWSAGDYLSSEKPFAKTARNILFGTTAMPENPPVISLIGDGDAVPLRGTAMDPLRGTWAPSPKPALFRGDETFRLPNCEGGVNSIDMHRLMRCIATNVLQAAVESDDFMRLVKQAKTQWKSGETTDDETGDSTEENGQTSLSALGLVLTHPGHTSFEAHVRFLQGFYEALVELHQTPLFRELGFPGKLDEEIALVRAFPEPAAVIAQVLQGNFRANRITAIDLGMHTIDIALAEKSSEADDKKDEWKVTACNGADLGGRRLDFTLVEAIGELLDMRLAHRGVRISDSLPTSEDKLTECMLRCKSADRTTIHAYERLQSILRSVEAGKVNLGLGEGALTIDMVSVVGEHDDARDWMPPNIFDIVSAAGGTALSFTYEQLSRTRAMQRYQAAVRLFVGATLSPSGKRLEGVDVVVAGRAGLSIFLDRVIRETIAELGGAQRPTYAAREAKAMVVQGAALLADRPSMLRFAAEPDFVLLQFRGERLMDFAKLDRVSSQTINVAAGATGVVIVPLHSAIAEKMLEDAGNGGDQLKWWLDALLLSGYVREENRTPPDESGLVTVQREFSEASGATTFLNAAIRLGRKVQVWRILEADDAPREYKFALYGGYGP